MYTLKLSGAVILMLIFSNNMSYGQFSKQNNIVSREWKVGYSDSKDENPVDFYPSDIPGAVQLDYMKAKNMSPFEFDDNFKDYKFLEDKFWLYQTEFDRPEIPDGFHLCFYSKGIDYKFDIFLNDQLLLSQEGMFTPVSLVLDEFLKDNNLLEILIYPIPKDKTQPEGRREAKNSVKPPVPYGWDWHPRLVPVGIWDETWIEISPKTQITFDNINYQLEENLNVAQINYIFSTSNFENSSYEWNIHDAEGKLIFNESGRIKEKTTTIDATINDINLWWPHDFGVPYLYDSELKIIGSDKNVLDKRIKKIGFRKVQFLMNEGAWDEPVGFPKTRSAPPFQLEVNGKKIFAKGSNWLHPEIFYGTIDKKRYSEQLELAKKANFNILRVWGGGIINKESFFEICDSIGIMVWQEFPLACNPYPDDKKYLDVLRQEAASIIYKVKQYPSLVLWSGGNELFNRWSGMTDQSLALRLLNSLCFEIDPNTPFIMTSPVMGVGHGHYLFYDDATQEEVFQIMKKAHNTAYTEFGMPGMADKETLIGIIPENEFFPPEPGTSWETHHAFGAWKKSSWLEMKTLEKYFGKAKTLEELIQQSQLLQSVGYKCIFESARMKKPYCSMAINWCYNEPWPTAVNNSLIGYPNKPKPAYDAVSESCRPVLASAAFNKFSWKPDEELELDCYILNDSPREVTKGNIDVYVLLDRKKIKILSWDYPNLEPNTNFHGPLVRYKLPGGYDKQVFQVLLESKEDESLNSSYYLLYNSRKDEKPIIYDLNQ